MPSAWPSRLELSATQSAALKRFFQSEIGAAVLWVLGIILYFRLLGRLLWYVQNYRRQRDKPE